MIQNDYINYIIYLLPLITSMVLAATVIPRMKLDSINHKRILVGGVSIFPLILISINAMLAAPTMFGIESISFAVSEASLRLMQLIVGMSILYVIGIKDDLHGTSSTNIFLSLLLSASLFPITGLYFNNLYGLFGLYEIPIWLGVILTIFFTLYITIIFRLVDGVDGLCSGLASIATLCYLCISLWKEFVIAGIASSALLGVVVTFWAMKIFGRKNKKTIMGSAGSYVIGYLISYLAIGLSRQGGGRLPDGMPLISFSVILIPAFDILRVLVSRAREMRGIAEQDNNQINHKLVRAGFSRVSIVAILAGLTIFFVAITTVGVVFEINPTIILFADIVLFLGLQYLLNFFISRNRNISYFRRWRKEYGREAWNSAIPEEKLRRKQQEFSYMGLPKYIVEGNDIHFIPDGMNALERNTKRLFDFAVSTICLILFSPLFLICYILIKCDDGGPAIFRQERIGRFGRPFYIYKFRTMRVDAEKYGPELSHSGGDEDPRLTKTGRFLRAHHLDELPQLWNVFIGDMSFIGYRPERNYYIRQIMDIDPRYAFLYQIRPGVTSYATLYNGYTDTMEKMQRRLELDLYYLGHRSWYLDFKVLLITFLRIIGGKKF